MGCPVLYCTYTYMYSDQQSENSNYFHYIVMKNNNYNNAHFNLLQYSEVLFVLFLSYPSYSIYVPAA